MAKERLQVLHILQSPLGLSSAGRREVAKQAFSQWRARAQKPLRAQALRKQTRAEVCSTIS